MKEIEITYVIEATEAEVSEYLSPKQIAEYMGYSVRDTKQTGKADLLRVAKYDTEFTLDFREVSGGYEFSLYGSDGPFRTLNGLLQVESAPNVQESEASRVTVDITYTIGTVFSFLLDYLARRIMRNDAERLLQGLARDIAGEESDSDDAENGSDRQRDPETTAVPDDETSGSDGDRSE